MSQSLNRRSFLKGLAAAAVVTPVLYACAPQQPASSGESAAPTQPAASTGPAQQPASADKPTLRSTLWAEQSGEGRTWMKDKALEWAEKTGTANVEIEMVNYNEMQAKQLTAVAAGTLWDVFFSTNRWGPYSAYKGVHLFLDDLVDAAGTDLSDFVPRALEGARFEEKLFGLPAETNPGNQNCVYYNKALLGEFGVPEPTDDWTWQDYVEMSAKCTDTSRRIFGTNLLPTNYYDFGALARTFGGEVFDAEKKNFALISDPKTAEAMKSLVELRTVHKAAPSRDEAEGLNFFTGQLALRCAGPQVIKATQASAEEGFEWDLVLGPKGPDGARGYSMHILVMAIGSTTKHPQEAYSLLEYLTSQETAQWAFENQSQPTARLSVMRSAAAEQQHPIWKRVADWFDDGVNQGPTPIPWNLRVQELQDTWANLSPELMYGEVPFEEGMANVQKECQAIMDLPRIE